ncbi:MAG: sensor histidine kinase, partial [Pseudomonadota bacterium]
MGLFRGLSGRLLVLTVAVVMVVEVIVFVPSVARFRQDYLEERIARAHLSALAVMAAPDFMVTKEMERALLDGAGVRNVVLVREGARALILTSPGLGQVAESFDLRGQGAGQTIADALSRLVRPSGAEVIRVIGATPEGGPPGQAEALEITLDAAPLRVAMLDYGLRVLNLSLVISLFTATVVFLVIRRVVVSPLVRLSGAVRRFQDDPEDPAREIRPSGGAGEVAEAEAAIAAMQADVRRALAERARLASLGTALSKISHDLRNMLAAQLLMTDRLGRSSDPVVMRVAPKL